MTSILARARKVPCLTPDQSETLRSDRLAFNPDHNAIEPEVSWIGAVEKSRLKDARQESRAILCADLAHSDRLPVDRYVRYHGILQPVAPSGCAFASERFAAYLNSTARHEFSCKFLGFRHLSRGHDKYPVYQVVSNEVSRVAQARVA